MKKVKNKLGFLTLALLLGLTSCDDDQQTLVAELPQEAQQEESVEPNEEMEKVNTTFNITIMNTVNYLNSIVFNTHSAATEPGPIPDAGCFYEINFKAVPGTKLSFATMQVISNDWFYAPADGGLSLFEEGSPATGDITDKIYLWDSGTEEEDPATITSVAGGATAGAPDDDNTVRIVETDVTDAIKVYLGYDDTTRYFTLKIENLRGVNAETNPVMLSPGLVVLHAQDNALFTKDEADRGLGLAKIAVQGNPSDLHGWFTETGSDGAPLRLSSSFTVFAPGVVYAFDSESDPVFMQGEPMVTGSGIEEIAEDGNNGAMFDYITNDLMLPAAKSNEVMPIGPGGSLTFTLEVPEGYKLGYNTMFVFSNDWFLAHNNSGFDLFADDGTPVSGYGATEKTYLYDAGTEIDQPVGFGPDQAPFQSGPNTGAADDNNLIRRVMEINDLQFGKGSINSATGVAGYADPRGGYNIVRVSVEPN
ncbi:spondin domain-containing protein [Maribacter halichondriae]|uniref:spondin domain-containing protein n=1 Tax=Maribacter halichondriae TaxID=2980554 RepID=UPI002359A507|nr:spondin domain-containing protein [Maribacter sp. Hal144]